MPPFSNSVTISVACLSLGVTSALLIHRTQAQVPPTGTFTATQACPATQAINGKNPGNIKLTVGVLYAVVGFNNPQRQFVLLEVPQATPDRRWVKATCGNFQASGVVNPSPKPSPTLSPTPSPTSQPGSSLLPFFDTEDDPVSVDFPSGAQKDISPPPPELEEFDRKILALCGGEFDAPVSNVKFRQLMTFYPDVVRDLKQVTDGELKPKRRSDSQFLDDLTAIWFEQKGFKHIFCGEQDGKSMRATFCWSVSGATAERCRRTHSSYWQRQKGNARSSRW
ncbi:MULTISPECIES: hypothetical protein [Cyanophyceae]|uniref:GUN4-like domain-containing protein n=1 Tax=Stenomitos frigidus AS-A4 TaxID=2933935 RepID=A0ABV0KMZ5_9CYAN|nr:hypothetical protein [Phormidium sp. FACHB-592]